MAGRCRTHEGHECYSVFNFASRKFCEFLCDSVSLYSAERSQAPNFACAMDGDLRDLLSDHIAAVRTWFAVLGVQSGKTSG